MIEWLLLYFPYIGLWLLIILGGIGLPFPEDLTLILAGQLAHEKGLSLPLIFVVSFLAIIPTDFLLYYIGRKYGSRVWRLKIIRRFLTPQRRVKVKEQFKKRGDIVVFIARFIGGFRTPVFITAGTLKMSPWRFLFLDVAASLISIPIFVLTAYYLGRVFADRLNVVMHEITLWIIGVIAIFFVITVVKAYWDERK